MSASFLESIALERTLPCLAEPGRIIVVGVPSRSLAEVLPFLATLPNLIAYNPEAVSLTLRRAEGLITLNDRQVLVTKVKDVAEGCHLLALLMDAINATWDHRDELIPVRARRRAPGPLDIWRLLPHTNCRACGLPTCMAFAVALLQRETQLQACPFLCEGVEGSTRRAALEGVL